MGHIISMTWTTSFPWSGSHHFHVVGHIISMTWTTSFPWRGSHNFHDLNHIISMTWAKLFQWHWPHHFHDVNDIISTLTKAVTEIQRLLHHTCTTPAPHLHHTCTTPVSHAEGETGKIQQKQTWLKLLMTLPEYWSPSVKQEEKQGQGARSRMGRSSSRSILTVTVF